MATTQSYMVNGHEIRYEVRDIPQDQLQFYVENPRVYSLMKAKGIESQEEIEEHMCSMEHVKALKHAILTQGGLIDAVVVLGDGLVVIEGNSRLAAYRMLHQQDPIKWNMMKCYVLQSGISSDDIFGLLGNWHIRGKTPWTPYEQAAFLARQREASKKPLASHARALGLSEQTALQYVETYGFMREHQDSDVRHWSHYFEFLRNRAIGKYTEQVPALTETIASQIKSGAIRDAKDIRKLGDMAKVSTKSAKKIMYQVALGKKSIYDGYEEIKDTGAMDDVVKKIEKFRAAVNDEGFETQCVVHKDLGKIQYGLKEIKKAVEKLLIRLEKAKQSKV